MAGIFILDIFKEYNNQPWGNRYLLKAFDLNTAANCAAPMAEQEKFFHSQAVQFVSARVSSVEASDDLYVSVPLSGTGAIVIVNPVIPMQTCVMADVLVAGFGRPSKKYYHVCVDADSFHPTTPQHWATALLATLTGAVAEMPSVCAEFDTEIVDPDQQLWTTTVRADPKFRYHQFHKRSPRQPA